MLTTTSYANAWQETLQNQSKYFVCTSYDACKSLRNKGNDDGNDDGNTDGNEQNRKHVNSEQSGESHAYRFEISTKIWLSAETRKPICNKCKGKNDIRIKSLEHLNACLYSAENTFQAELERRRQELMNQKEMRCTLRKELAEKRQRVQEFQSGIDRNMKIDSSVDTTGESESDANTCLHTQPEVFREKFPLHAQKWYGNGPTDQQVQEEKRELEEIETRVANQNKTYVIAIRKFEKDKSSFHINDYDDDDENNYSAGADGSAGAGADGSAGAGAEDPDKSIEEGEDDEKNVAEPIFEETEQKKRRGGRKRKKSPDEMTAEELEEAQEKKRKQAEARKEAAEERKRMLSNYPEMEKKASKYERAKTRLADMNTKIALQRQVSHNFLTNLASKMRVDPQKLIEQYDQFYDRNVNA